MRVGQEAGGGGACRIYSPPPPSGAHSAEYSNGARVNLREKVSKRQTLPDVTGVTSALAVHTVRTGGISAPAYVHTDFGQFSLLSPCSSCTKALTDAMCSHGSPMLIMGGRLTVWAASQCTGLVEGWQTSDDHHSWSATRSSSHVRPHMSQYNI